MDINQNWSNPAGMHDWLPPEAGEKRALTAHLLREMALWGYEEIATPHLEHFQTLSKGENRSGPDRLYKLIERDGSILVLRPEMTIPIARVVGTKMEGNLPWRLMYGGEVFRYEDVQAGRQREFNQVGVELIGQSGPEADSEILALTIELLQSIGLRQFTVSLGHTGVLEGLLGSLSCDEQAQIEVCDLILEKDFAGLSHFLEKAGMENTRREELVSLLTQPLSLEQIDQILPALPAMMQEALAEIKSIYELVERYGYGSYLQVDLSTLRRQAYYTGMVFEIYTAGIGYPIGGGGRYDRLLQHFGRDLPATGFALGVERLLLSLPPRKKRAKEAVLLAGVDSRRNNSGDVIRKAQDLRRQGKTVLVELRDLPRQEAAGIAREKGAELIWCGEVNASERIPADNSPAQGQAFPPDR